ncbi:SGNH/GDSL hydrolase family protein [Microbacterium sp. VKM Ac-2870]|nr:SGNH/GDSL hydrolase family protein [Microbacterium sp. VKM Ac-2870]MBF4563246.1 SGNH/GDSL hydrolase family protein [Microbacterium sp. VKM Ac-2870]
MLAVGVSVAASVLVTRRVLTRQAAIARRRIGKPLGEIALDADRRWRAKLPGEPIELLVVGDSIAAGLGAERPKDVLGARLAKGIAAFLQRPVQLRTVAVVGAQSVDLAGQLERLPEGYRADAAVIIVGGNDVTHRTPVLTAAAQLEVAVRALRSAGTAVVVGTCPDLGALRPVPQPLRSLGAQASRQLAHAQAAAARRAGARVVSLRRAVGPMFIAHPEDMFSLDRFHPSALGYRRTADALVPEIVAALADGSVSGEAPRR